METLYYYYHEYCILLFKIDFIVWKPTAVLFLVLVSAPFKIDFIVWKHGAMLFDVEFDWK